MGIFSGLDKHARLYQAFARAAAPRERRHGVVFVSINYGPGECHMDPLLAVALQAFVAVGIPVVGVAESETAIEWRAVPALRAAPSPS